MLFDLRFVPTSEKEFVDFWSRHYSYPSEHLYDDNIGKPLTPKRVRALYGWKNGGKLSGPKTKSVESNYVDRIAELDSLDPTTEPREFLSIFAKGGAIWRIYWLHLWQPDRFPIYDQHVHRAMQFVEQREVRELQGSGPAKIDQYLDNFLPFCQRFEGLDRRKVDRALWAFGKFMKPLVPEGVPYTQ